MKQSVEVFAVKEKSREKTEINPGSQNTAVSDEEIDEDDIPLSILAKKIRKEATDETPSSTNDQNIGNTSKQRKES